MFTLLLGVNGIASETYLTLDDTCICYTDKQDLNCLRCLLSETKKDSLIAIRDIQVKEIRKDYLQSVDIIEDLRLEAILKDEEIVKLKTHRKILLSVSGGLIGLVVILFLVP